MYRDHTPTRPRPRPKMQASDIIDLTMEGDDTTSDLTDTIQAEFTCPICHSLLAAAQGLECGHMFCSACISPWISNNATCPTCRASATVKPVRQLAVDNVVAKLATVVLRGDDLVQWKKKLEFRNGGNNTALPWVAPNSVPDRSDRPRVRYNALYSPHTRHRCTGCSESIAEDALIITQHPQTFHFPLQTYHFNCCPPASFQGARADGITLVSLKESDKQMVMQKVSGVEVQQDYGMRRGISRRRMTSGGGR